MIIKKVPISKCRPWDKNPRKIAPEDAARLKKQIQKLKVYKPMIAYQEGKDYIILGGNMRLSALKELGHKEVEISIVKPKNEAEKIEYNLSDNDGVGKTDLSLLTELVLPIKDEIDLKDYKVNLDLGQGLETLFEDAKGLGGEPGDNDKEPEMVKCPKCGHEFVDE